VNALFAAVARAGTAPVPATTRTLTALLAIITAAALAGCVTESQKRGAALADSNNAMVTQMNTCFEGVYAQPAFDAARRRLPADMSQATLEQETDPSIARDTEIAAVFAVQPQLQECRRVFLDKLGATPTLLYMYATVLTLSESSLGEVLQKKKSWGDHVRDVKELLRKSKLDLDDETKRIAGGLSQAPKDVQARQETADKAMLLYNTMEKAFTTMRRPIITKCERYNMAGNCV
jgi:hypothetical protein